MGGSDGNKAIMKIKLTTFAKLSLVAILIASAGVGCKKTPTGVTPLPNAALTGEAGITARGGRQIILRRTRFRVSPAATAVH